MPACTQKTLARVAERSAKGEFGYNKFFAIGLFRLLEVVLPGLMMEYQRSCPEDDGFEASLSSSPCRDLMLYKSILSKLNAAKELMAEFVQREKKKQAEREADKAARAAKVCMYVCAHLRALHVLNFGPLRARLRRRQCTRSPEAVSYVMLPHFTG
eukprot:scaffold217480_cov19-Tisochrysis_lutea.AAC.2